MTCPASERRRADDGPVRQDGGAALGALAPREPSAARAKTEACEGGLPHEREQRDAGPLGEAEDDERAMRIGRLASIGDRGTPMTRRGATGKRVSRVIRGV